MSYLFDPLIPANTETQMAGPEGAFDPRRAFPAHRKRHSIWVPAFAGMSGNGDA